MTKLLINEYPLMVLPTLAKEIGLNEAIILQQVHYWLDPRMNKNKREGVYWVYNTYKKWQEQFSFLSLRTIQRAIQSLEKKNLLISKQLSKNLIDKTKWYTINYQALDHLSTKFISTSHYDVSKEPDCHNEGAKLAPSLDNAKLAPSTKRAETSHETSLTVKTDLENNGHSTFIDKERDMLNIWCEILEEKGIEILFTAERKVKLKKYFKKYFNEDIQKWKKFCEDIRSSNFLMGKVTNFKASVDWALKDENIIKIFECNYGIIRDSNAFQEEVNIGADQNINFLDEGDEIKIIRHNLLKKVGQDKYNAWFTDSIIMIEKEILSIKVSTRFRAEYITQYYLKIIEETVDKLLNTKTKIYVFN